MKDLLREACRAEVIYNWRKFSGGRSISGLSSNSQSSGDKPLRKQFKNCSWNARDQGLSPWREESNQNLCSCTGLPRPACGRAWHTGMLWAFVPVWLSSQLTVKGSGGFLSQTAAPLGPRQHTAGPCAGVRTTVKGTLRGTESLQKSLLIYLSNHLCCKSSY